MADDRPPAITTLHGAIGQRAGNAGDEHEDFGRVAEPVVLKRKPTADVVRDVIEKDEPECDAPARVQTKVAVDRLVRKVQSMTLRVE